MRLSLAYGTGSFDVETSGREIVAAANAAAPAIADETAALERALESPVGCGRLDRILPRTGTVCVLVSDLTRGAGAARLLGPLLRSLERRGAGPERVQVLLALGMHRAQRGAELEAHLGAGVLGRWNVREHDALDAAGLEEAGKTPAGTPCAFNRAAVAAALVIPLSAVSFHYFAGFGGARKLILPGIAGERSILANHRLSLRADPGEGLCDGCRPGNLDGNPVHEDMLAGARLIGPPVFAVNSVAGSHGETLFVNAGELDVSHRAACDFLAAHFTIPLERRYRAVLLSAGGHPRDGNLLQSHKALRNASYALEEGGLMLAAAECREGVGSQSLADAFAQGRSAVPEKVRRRYTLNAQTAVSIHNLTARFSIYLRTAMADAGTMRFGFCPWKEGYADFLLHGFADGDILLLPDASLFLPAVRESTRPAGGAVN